MRVTKEQQLCIRFCTNIEKKCNGDPGNIGQAFGEESLSQTFVFEWKSPNSLRPKKVKQVKSDVRSMLIISFDIKGIIHKEFILAGRTVNFTFYCAILW
jgi:hypothetical protein